MSQHSGIGGGGVAVRLEVLGDVCLNVGESFTLPLPRYPGVAGQKGVGNSIMSYLDQRQGSQRPC